MELIVVGSIMIILLASMRYPGHGVDWEIFAGAADGDFTSDYGLGYYYAYWLLPIFDLYSLAGITVGGLLWSMTNVAGIWFAARVFGARPAVVIGGFGVLTGFYTGTITGVAVGAIAGIWWALHEQRWEIVGALSLLAVAKPQWGVPIAGLLVLQARPPLVGWLKMAWIPIAVAGASLAVYGWWPGEILDRAADNPPEGNGSLWFFLGPGVLVLWLGALLPMDARRRLLVVAACSLMAVPYVQQYDYVMLWVLTADGIGLLSYLHGPLFSAFGWDAARGFQTFMPLAVYATLVAEPLQAFVRDRGRHGLRQPA